MKTIAEITAAVTAEFTPALQDNRKCMDMATAELESGGSMLASMASEAGCDSLRGYINEGNQWSARVCEVADLLAQSIAMFRAEAAGHGPFDDMNQFLAAR